MEIYGYRRSYFNTFLTWLAILASGFLLRLIFYWKPHWMLYSTSRRCTLDEAEKVLLIDKYNQYFVEQVRYLFGAPHPATLIHKGTFHQPDEDEILSCRDDPYRYAKHNYGSFMSHSQSNSPSPILRQGSNNSDSVNDNNNSGIRSRRRTVSARSNKSTLTTTDNDDQSSDGEEEEREEHEGKSSDTNNNITNDYKSNNDEKTTNTDTMMKDQVIVKFSSDQKGDDGLLNAEEATYKVRFFENKKIRYIWDEDDGNFVRLRGFDKNVTFSKLKTMTNGLSKNEQWRRRQLFGENAIHIEIQPYLRILFEEVLGPFYIFQLFSITVWFNDDYYYYGTCIIIMSLSSLVSSVIQIRRNQVQLRDTVESVDYVKVCRGKDHYEDIESSEIVPGDIVVVPTFNSVLQFDGILINGNVIVNESMLTGESVPVTKTPLPLQNSRTKQSSKSNQNDTYYDEKEHSKHTLFCGTKVLQTRYYGGVYVKALVVRVGFQTAKGELIRSIMFPKPVDFRFNRQIHKFIGVLACLATIGFLYSVIIKTQRGADLKTILISALDLITIVIPPALPAAMTIGIIYAQSRLKSNKIFCISPRSINISGCINCVCFDKTGTLTEDNLSFNEVVPAIKLATSKNTSIDDRNQNQNQSSPSLCKFGGPFDEEIMQTSSKKVERDHNLLLDNGNYSPLLICLASCHSLTIIDQKLIGDPLDLQMFEATGWVLEEPDVDDENKFDLLAPTVVRPPRKKRRTPPEAEFYLPSSTSLGVAGAAAAAASIEHGSSGSSTEDELDNVDNTNRRCQNDVGILRQFPFSSSLQRMSVITRQFSGNQYVVYAKGAPEKIASLCKPDTIPEDFSEVLHNYTRKGFRVLALAYRPLKAGLSYTRMQRDSRQDIEKDLRFLGLLTLGNLLKPETIPVIETLNKAAIRSIMVTGDNMLTAISVANECGMIASYDKTILLQVETKKDDGRTTSASSLENSPTKQHQVITTTSSGGDVKVTSVTTESEKPTSASHIIASHTPDMTSIVLSVENIQLQSRNESDPILNLKRTRVPIKPKLVWHYVSPHNDQPHQPLETKPPPLGFLSTRREQSTMMMKNKANDDSIGRLKLFTNDPKTHLALTGETWDVILKYYPEMLNSICLRGTVFARMAPHQKQQLVEQLQALQYYVAMCGDGANDSGALRSAHAGISLSDTEASVAAPFTSANANISCVPTLIGEGRAALVTAFGILKYMAMYSLIQFCSVLCLYTLYTNFTDTQFLYEDLFIIATFVALFGRTEPYPTLDNRAPSSSLLSVTQLSSVSIQLALVLFFQIISLLILWQSPWYEAHPQNYDHELAGHDNFAIFAMSSFQCISLAIVFSKGKPYRKSILSNYLLTGSLAFITILTVTIIILPAEWDIPYISLEVLNVPIEFRIIMVCLALAHFVAAMIGERFIVDHLIFRKKIGFSFIG